MSPEESKRLDELERRLARIEGALNLGSAAATPKPAAPPAAIPSTATPIPVAARVAAPATTAAGEGATAAGVPPLLKAKAAGAPVMPELSRGEGRQSGIERSLGLHLAGWTGAVVVIIAAILGIKYAYDNGWFGNIPPGLRVILMACGGFALIGMGEVVFRRVNRYAASALFGAGVAVLFVVAAAGHSYYELYPPETAFWLSLLATLVGAALSVRGNLAAVAVLALIGGAIAPVQLGTGKPPGQALLIYVVILQVLALYLAWWGNAPKWWTLRGISLLANLVWFAVAIDGGAIDRFVLLAFTVFSASLYQSELIASSVRFKAGAKSAEYTKAAHDVMASLFSVSVTVLLAFAGMWLLRDDSRYMRTVWLLILAFFFAWQSFVLPRLLGENARALAQSFQVQAALLGFIAVPVALDGQIVAICWGALGVGFAWLALKQKRGLPLVLSALSLFIAATYWFFRELWEMYDAKARPAVFNAFTLAGAALMLAFYASGLITEKLDSERTPPRHGALRSAFWGAIPLIFWGGSCEIHRYFKPIGSGWIYNSTAEQLALSVFWGVTSIAMVLLGFKFKRQALRFGGLALFGVTLLKLVVIDGSSLSSGYRVLSFLGVGALLILTSVLYGKFKDA